MARPITWQDVTAPNQASNLQAAQNAGNQITAALSGIGTLGMNLRDQAREEATRAAVASIQNAADPAAAAAQVQQGWMIDPLAVATSANAREGQLLQQRATEEGILGTQVGRQLNQTRLEDMTAVREGARQAADLVGRMRETNKVIPVTRDDFTKDAAGDYAFQEYQKTAREIDDRNFRMAEFEWRKNQSRNDPNKLMNDAAGLMYEWSANEGAAADAGAIANQAASIARRLGLPAHVAQQLVPLHGQAVATFVPTSTQLSQVIAGDGNTPITGHDAKSIFQQAAVRLDRQQAELLNQVENGNVFSAKDLLNPSPYDELSNPERYALLVEISNQVDPFGFNWDANKAAKVVDKHLEAAKREGGQITAAQAAQLAEMEARGVSSKRIQAARSQFMNFEKNGGAMGLQREIMEKAKPIQSELARLKSFDTKLNASLRNGTPVPTNISDFVSSFKSDADIRQESIEQSEAQAAQARARRQQINEDVWSNMNSAW